MSNLPVSRAASLQFLFPFASETETDFNAAAFTQMHRDLAWLPLVVVALYLYGVVYRGQQAMQSRKLSATEEQLTKYTLVFWNFGLMAFSIVGFLRVFSYFAYVQTSEVLQNGNWPYFFCTPALEAYGSGPVAMWMMMFTWSKYVELSDTVFLVIRKKPVTFLHYFHHATVLLYCWYAGAAEQSTGIFFALMNYCVHALMYTYYTCQALCSVGWLLKRPPRWGKYVTCVQLAQMAGGVAVTAIHSWLGCQANRAILLAAALMYTVYGGLFLRFFINRYSPDKRESLCCVSTRN